MKATGIVRRIDELGRIVIPKEIRKTFRIKEGDSLEIYIENDENIILKKHSILNKMEDFAQNFTDSIYSFIKHNIIITNKDNIIAISGPLKKEYINKSISKYLEDTISRRVEMVENYIKEVNLVEDKTITGTYVINSIVVNGDVEGLVIVFSTEDKIDENDQKVANIASSFLSKYLED